MRNFVTLLEKVRKKTKAIEKLAHRVEDFAYDLLDQVKRREEKNIHDKEADRYASLFSEVTLNAIVKGQQKVRHCSTSRYIILQLIERSKLDRRFS